MRSMRLFLLLSFNSLLLLEAYASTGETDRQALLKLKSQFSEEKRVVLSSWNNSSPLCKWNGITCGHKHKRVTRLDLGGLNLGGVISPSIGNLSFLISLDLNDNSFSGIIPQEIGKLFRLQDLNMSFNFLRGEIPIGLYNCSRLMNLDFYSNHLGQDVPSKLGSLRKLITLDLGQNNFKGKLPPSLGNLTSLIYLNFADNKIGGVVPHDIARLAKMVSFELSVNNFSGVFPPAIYNLSSLEYLYIFANRFSGTLRHDFGNLLPNLRHLYMGMNSLTGVIPTTLSNISNLQVLTMEYNSLSGTIPPSFGKVGDLKHLSLHHNGVGSYSSGDLEFLGALTNCTQLQILVVGKNRLGGELPSSIANLSTNLINLSLQENYIFGSIPHNIGNLKSLQRLKLGENLLTGILPTSLGKLSNLGLLSLHSNRMSGKIPSSISNLTQLELLYLFNNSFNGVIPPSLGNCSHLLDLRIGYNNLSGTIPWEIMQISTLVNISLANNYLSGTLPDVGTLENLVGVSVAYNNLSEKLPKTLGKCLSMERLFLQGNSFDGTIPDISGMVGVKRVDFSNNNLSGRIPKYFANFSSLEYLNLSVNHFEGSVPREGNFQNATKVLVFGNKDLCGGISELELKPCIAEGRPLKTKHFSHRKKVVVGVCIGISLLSLLFIALVSLIWYKRKGRKTQHTNNPTPTTLGTFHEKISYGDLRNATDGFSSSNFLGSGSFGTVFKALLPLENKVVAVKVLNMERRGAMKSFMAECEALKEIRHHNLVKLLTVCSSIDFQGNEFKALIYEFMPNGNLDMWLHQEEVEEIRRPSRTLTVLERLNIAIDIASFLEYLHLHCHEPIAHCDLKPSNVLLDDDMIAHVSDFGLARFLLKFDKEFFINQLSSAGVRGTIGYVAPEYGMGGQPSIHGDVYSFGVLILEMFTGKKPTNELFTGSFTLHSYTKSSLPERVLDIADKCILHHGLNLHFPIAECLTLVLDVGVRCCEESPTNRLITSQATKELISIRERFFKAK